MSGRRSSAMLGMRPSQPLAIHSLAPWRRGSSNEKTPVLRGFSEADEGTRTLDLLHGNAPGQATGAVVCRLSAIVDSLATRRLFSRGNR